MSMIRLRLAHSKTAGLERCTGLSDTTAVAVRAKDIKRITPGCIFSVHVAYVRMDDDEMFVSTEDFDDLMEMVNDAS